jgi:adenylate kinase family enzyme
LFYLKIHIIGASGIGKTYIATKLQKLMNSKAYDLDKIFWDQSKKKLFAREQASRTEKLNQVLSKEHWIVEGVY